MTAPKRREYRTGSIYRRHDTPTCPPLEPGPPHPKTGKPTEVRPVHECDGLWVGTLEAGWNEKGKRRRATVSAKTRAAVVKKLRDRRRQLERDGDTGVSVRTTVKAWAEIWLAEQEKHLRPSAFTASQSAVTKWIVPTIGHKRFDLLTPADVRAVTQAQREAKPRPLKTSTQRRTHSVLKSLLKDAIAEGFPVPQRLLQVKAPAPSVTDRKDIPPSEAVAILEQASRLPHGSRFLVALMQGLRQGEALGLTWDEVDFDNDLLHLAWQLQALRYRIPRDRSSGFRVPDGYECRQLQGALHLVRPKSRAGIRVIPMVEPVRNALLAWRDIAPDSPHGLVWPDLDGGPTYYKTDDEEWYALQGAASLTTYDPYTELAPLLVGHPGGRYYGIHETRHTTVTLLLEAGVPEAIIIAIVGHSAWASAQAYAHVNQGAAREALAAVARRLELNPAPTAATE